MDKAKDRESNIELLRIISMFFIILHHLVYHNYIFLIDNPNKTSAIILYSGAKIGVTCFILILGYFSINSKFNIKKIIYLIVTVLFYELLFSIIFYKQINFSFREFYNNLQQYWFINGYIITYLLSPILKIYIKKAPNILQGIILVIAIIFSVRHAMDENMYILWFLVLFVLGIYIKKYLIEKLKNDYINLFIIISLYIILVTKNLGIYLIEPIVLLCSIFVLLFFANLKIKQNQTINNIAKYTLGIYLIHDNVYVRKFVIQQKLFIKEMYNSNYFTFYMIIVAILIYAISIIIDYAKTKIFNKIIFKNEKINNLYIKINNFMNQKIGE